MIDLGALRADHQRLARGREQVIDPVGVAHVGRLLDRASTLPEGARERLLVRAQQALAALRERTDRSHHRAVARIDALDRAGFEVVELRARLSRGETLAVERAHGVRAALGREVRRRDPALEARLASLARRVGIETVGPLDSIGLGALVGRLYKKAASEAATGMLLERAQRNRPADAGRYHTGSVAAAILLAMRDASAPYLRAQLAKLELAAEVQRFLAAFEPLPEPKPTTSRSARTGRATGQSSTARRTQRAATDAPGAEPAAATKAPSRKAPAAPATRGRRATGAATKGAKAGTGKRGTTKR